MSEKTYRSVAKADNNPNPATNPELKRICEQLQEVLDQINKDMTTAGLADDWKEVAKLSLLAGRAREIMQKFACGGISIVSALDQLLVDLSVATK